MRFNRRTFLHTTASAAVATMSSNLIHWKPAAAQSTNQLGRTAALNANPPTWLNLNPGGGGQVQCVYPDPNTPGRLYETADLEGLYRSDDYGSTWHYIGSTVLTGDTRCLIAEPGNANRLYLGTNYGLAISDDAGATWTPVNSPAIAPGTPFDTLAVDPNNVNNVYAAPSWEEDDGHLNEFDNVAAYAPTGQRQLYVSRDRGQTWNSVQFDSNDGYKQVFSISIDPRNSHNIYLGADGGVYVSRDSGSSWQKLSIPNSTQTTSAGKVYPNSRGAALTPDGQYLIATYATGLNTGQNPADAQISYVTTTSLFFTTASSAPNCTWQEMANATSALADPANNKAFTQYARPVIDPRSTPSNIKVLTGPLPPLGNYGLFEGTFSVDSGGTVSGSWTKVFENRPFPTSQQPPVPTFDVGWNDIQPFVREYAYTPTSWPSRQVWMASQQTVYAGDPENPTGGWLAYSTTKVTTYDQQKITDSNGNVVQSGNIYSYVGRGISSTFNYDVAAYSSYMVQGMADNGLLESFDYGQSWIQRVSIDNRALFAVQSNPNFLEKSSDNINQFWINNGDAVLAVPVYPPIILAGIAAGYGGGSTEYGNGFLLAMKLSDTPSPMNTWQLIGGQQWSDNPPFVSKYYNNQNPPTAPVSINGLPPWRIMHMTYNPSNPDQVVIATHQGLYICYDILGVVNNTTGPQTTAFYSIGNTDMNTQSFRYVAFDPSDSNVLYAMSAPFNPSAYYGYQTAEGSVWRGTFNGTYWSWTQIYNRGGAGNADYDMAVWSNNGTTTIAITVFNGPIGGKGGVNSDSAEPASGGTGVYLSTDQGQNWRQVLSTSQVTRLRQWNWYNPNQYHLAITSLAAIRDQIFVTVGTHSYTKGYAVLAGTIQSDGSVSWRDWTGDYSYGNDGGFMPFPYARGKSRIFTVNGTESLYISTSGAGLWARKTNS